MSSSSTLALAELHDGPLYRFADWPNPEIPNGRIGVYTVWGGDELIYVGMGGRAVGPNADTNGPASTKLTGFEAVWHRTHPDAGPVISSASTSSTAWSVDDSRQPAHSYGPEGWGLESLRARHRSRRSGSL